MRTILKWQLTGQFDRLETEIARTTALSHLWATRHSPRLALKVKILHLRRVSRIAASPNDVPVCSLIASAISRAVFTSSPIPLRIRVADPSALLWLGTACFYSAACYLDCLIIVGQS